MRTISFDESDHDLSGFEEGQVERLLWNLEVLREQLGELTICAGSNDLSDDTRHPGVGVRAPGYDPRHIAGVANELQRVGRMDRGAVYIFEDCVYIDSRGTPVRGGGNAEGVSPMTVELTPGLDIRTVYSGGQLRIDREFTRPVAGALTSERLTERTPESKQSDEGGALALPSGPMLKVGLAVGAGALVLTGAWYAVRTMRRAAKKPTEPK